MNHHKVYLRNRKLTESLLADIQLGQYFIYFNDYANFVKHGAVDNKMRRLHIHQGPERRVVPLYPESPFENDSLRIQSKPRYLEALNAVVVDRDLYRAEEDTVNIFAVYSGSYKKACLQVTCNGDFFQQIDLAFQQGVAVDSLALLLAGEYQVQLWVDDGLVGRPASFTVAAYELAPLVAHMDNYLFSQASQRCEARLTLQRYDINYCGHVLVSLMEGDREMETRSCRSDEQGCVQVAFDLYGEGPYRLRIQLADDPEHTAEVTLPGSRVQERQQTQISELGREMFFALMPAEHTEAVRGGFISKGDHVSTPLSVQQCVTDDATLTVHKDIEDLTLVILDLQSATYASHCVGDVKQGDEVKVPQGGAMIQVFIGGFVNRSPFEAFTTFIKPSRLALSLEVPATIEPRQNLKIALAFDEPRDHGMPVLLSIRDQRLTATDSPAKALASCMKQTLADATVDFNRYHFEPLSERLPNLPGKPVLYKSKRASRDRDRDRESSTMDLMAGGALDILADVIPAPMPHMSMADAERGLSEAEPERSEFPEQLYFGLIELDSRCELDIPLADALGQFVVEAFVYHHGDWSQVQKIFEVRQKVRVDLELPAAMFPQDHVEAKVRIGTDSGRGLLSIYHENEPLQDLAHTFDKELTTPMEFVFPAKPGRYRAELIDPVSGRKDTVVKEVTQPGKIKQISKPVAVLLPNQAIHLDSDENILGLRLLPGMDEPVKNLVTATADYTHLCCEQTAAKILAATLMYLTAEDIKTRQKAEQIILSGIERESHMITDTGFLMYPESGFVSDYYSPLATRYLWKLHALENVPNLSHALSRAVQKGIEFADRAARIHGLEKIPQTIGSMEDAYVLGLNGGDSASITDFVLSQVDIGGGRVVIRHPEHAVSDRATLSYAAAALLTMNDYKKGLVVANEVLKHLDEQGALYSTVDSVAAMALMTEMQKISTGPTSLRINGQTYSDTAAMEPDEAIESIEVLDGIALVEVNRLISQDWDTYQSAFTVKAGFRDNHGNQTTHFKPGERTELKVQLPEGYRNGDLLHVQLPQALSWIKGGGKIKQFSLDFAGRDELHIPLAVTSPVRGKQHFAVCVRNMFEQERSASPGLMTVEGS